MVAKASIRAAVGASVGVPLSIRAPKIPPNLQTTHLVVDLRRGLSWRHSLCGPFGLHRAYARPSMAPIGTSTRVLSSVGASRSTGGWPVFGTQ